MKTVVGVVGGGVLTGGVFTGGVVTGGAVWTVVGVGVGASVGAGVGSDTVGAAVSDGPDGGALPVCAPGATGNVDALAGADDPGVVTIVVVGPGTDDFGGFADAGFAFGLGFGGAGRGGAPVAVAVPPPTTLAVDAPEAGAVVPIEAMIERKPEMLRPATRMRVAAAGWRRRRHAKPPATADSGARREAEPRQPFVEIGRFGHATARLAAPARLRSILGPPLHCERLGRPDHRHFGGSTSRGKAELSGQFTIPMACGARR